MNLKANSWLRFNLIDKYNKQTITKKKHLKILKITSITLIWHLTLGAQKSRILALYQRVVDKKELTRKLGWAELESVIATMATDMHTRIPKAMTSPRAMRKICTCRVPNFSACLAKSKLDCCSSGIVSHDIVVSQAPTFDYWHSTSCILNFRSDGYYRVQITFV